MVLKEVCGQTWQAKRKIQPAPWTSPLRVSQPWCGAVLLTAGGGNLRRCHVMISAGFYGVYAEAGPAFEARKRPPSLVTTRRPSMGDLSEAIRAPARASAQMS